MDILEQIIFGHAILVEAHAYIQIFWQLVVVVVVVLLVINVILIVIHRIV